MTLFFAKIQIIFESLIIADIQQRFSGTTLFFAQPAKYFFAGYVKSLKNIPFFFGQKNENPYLCTIIFNKSLVHFPDGQ